jgi:hypothetical protein
MKLYHVDIGNSSDGPLGLCAVVRASSKRRAVDILRERLPSVIEVKSSEVHPPMDESEGEYINIYINTSFVDMDDTKLMEE